MQKIKLTATLLIVYCLLLIGFVFARPALAVTPPTINGLPGYIDYTDFKLSCTPTATATTAQFSSKKDGGSYTDFGSLITLSTDQCLVQVTGAQFGSEGKFWFKVTLNDGSFAEASTTLDTTAPGAVSDFGKERMNSGTTYHVHWKNPLDSDFVKVFIYRGTEAGFNADDSHKVAEVGGNPGDTQSWDNGGLDPTKEYFYVIRALDHAGNSSSLAGDAGTTTTTTTGTPKPGTTGQVTVLPAEQGTGSVLGTEASPSPQASATNTGYTYPTPSSQGGILAWIMGHKKISLGIAAVLAAVAYFVYRSAKRK